MLPFSTYPEDRERLLLLARKILRDDADRASIVELADLVVAILEDEEITLEAMAKEEQALCHTATS
jgi:hypothetical protein